MSSDPSDITLTEKSNVPDQELLDHLLQESQPELDDIFAKYGLVPLSTTATETITETQANTAVKQQQSKPVPVAPEIQEKAEEDDEEASFDVCDEDES